MVFKPTPEQQARIESARRDLETTQKLPGNPSRYFIDKCSSEAGIEPLQAVRDSVAPRKSPLESLVNRLNSLRHRIASH